MRFGGPFPSSTCLAVKLAMPSTRSKMRLDSTDHTVTLLICCQPNTANHLKLGKGITSDRLGK